MIRKAINSLLPKGAFWQPKPGGQFDQYLDGKSEMWLEVKNDLAELAYIREPQLTPVLDDLERELGFVKNDLLTEQERRDQLDAFIYETEGNGDLDTLQNTLIRAGFDLQVHANNPAIDPSIILDQAFRMWADSPTAFAGHQDALAGRTGGDLLVNGNLFKQTPAIIMNAGSSVAYAGHQDAVAGRFDNYDQFKKDYFIPTDSRRWPFVFFVGGDATRNATTGALEKIDFAPIPENRRNDLDRLILKIKPLFTWAGMVINYT